MSRIYKRKGLKNYWDAVQRRDGKNRSPDNRHYGLQRSSGYSGFWKWQHADAARRLDSLVSRAGGPRKEVPNRDSETRARIRNQLRTLSSTLKSSQLLVDQILAQLLAEEWGNEPPME